MNVLGMFARYPEPGKTKTRLGASIGNDTAARLYAAFVKDLIQNCQKCAAQFVVAATPNDKTTVEWFEKQLSATDQLIFQPDGNLRDRIEWFFAKTILSSGDRSVLIGSDSPDLPPSIIEAAFEKLQTADVVIAPACDGGFVLIGLSVSCTGLFESVSFSTPATLAQTIAACTERLLTVELLPLWYDVDTLENLGTLAALQRDQSQAASAPNSARVLASINFTQLCDI